VVIGLLLLKRVFGNNRTVITGYLSATRWKGKGENIGKKPNEDRYLSLVEGPAAKKHSTKRKRGEAFAGKVE